MPILDDIMSAFPTPPRYLQEPHEFFWALLRSRDLSGSYKRAVKSVSHTIWASKASYSALSGPGHARSAADSIAPELRVDGNAELHLILLKLKSTPIMKLQRTQGSHMYVSSF